MRKYYIDDLRWSAIAVLIVYHAAMAWNVWGEPNYIFFEGSRPISAIVTAFSPFLMPLLFVLAGMSTKYALGKRTTGQYLAERAKKLLIPFVFGTLVFMPVMTYLADVYNCGYTGNFIRHYEVFFTKFTDLTGADGGFSVGQFWFLLYLFVISVVFVGVRALQKLLFPKARKINIPTAVIYLLGIPLFLLHELLPIGGKSIFEYLYLFLLGYYVLSDDDAVGRLSAHKWVLSAAGAAATALNVYLFLWADSSVPAVPIMNTIARGLSEWLMVLAAIGLANSFRNKGGRLTEYMSRRSFMFYMLHFVWVVLFQYIFSVILAGNTFLLFIVPVLLAYAATMLSCEALVRIPAVCFLMGTKPLK